MIHLPNHNEIKKNIIIVEYFMSTKGIEIGYTLDGKDIILFAPPEEAASLLKKSGYISDYCGAGSEISIERETVEDFSDHHGEHVQQKRYEQLYWKDFVFSFHLSQHDAIVIITDYEFEKQMRNALEGALQEAKDKYHKLYMEKSEINNGFLS